MLMQFEVKPLSHSIYSVAHWTHSIFVLSSSFAL